VRVERGEREMSEWISCSERLPPRWKTVEQLKEKWLKQAIKQGKEIEMVFDDRKKVVDMWRRNGIFCFDCNQSGKEF
jgi:hypothetical protein